MSEQAYREEVGDSAYERQKAEAERGRCQHCWSLPDESHSALCPNRPEDEEPAIPSQEEGLF